MKKEKLTTFEILDLWKNERIKLKKEHEEYIKTKEYKEIFKKLKEENKEKNVLI